jgi:hypothetical protein
MLVKSILYVYIVSLRAILITNSISTNGTKTKKTKKTVVGQWTEKILFFNIIIIVNMFVHYTKKSYKCLWKHDDTYLFMFYPLYKVFKTFIYFVMTMTFII